MYPAFALSSIRAVYSVSAAKLPFTSGSHVILPVYCSVSVTSYVGVPPRLGTLTPAIAYWFTGNAGRATLSVYVRASSGSLSLRTTMVMGVVAPGDSSIGPNALPLRAGSPSISMACPAYSAVGVIERALVSVSTANAYCVVLGSNAMLPALRSIPCSAAPLTTVAPGSSFV